MLTYSWLTDRLERRRERHARRAVLALLVQHDAEIVVERMGVRQMRQAAPEHALGLVVAPVLDMKAGQLERRVCMRRDGLDNRAEHRASVVNPSDRHQRTAQSVMSGNHRGRDLDRLLIKSGRFLRNVALKAQPSEVIEDVLV